MLRSIKIFEIFRNSLILLNIINFIFQIIKFDNNENIFIKMYNLFYQNNPFSGISFFLIKL